MKWLAKVLRKLAPKRLPIPEPPAYPTEAVRQEMEYHDRVLHKIEIDLMELRRRSRMEL